MLPSLAANHSCPEVKKGSDVSGALGFFHSFTITLEGTLFRPSVRPFVRQAVSWFHVPTYMHTVHSSRG